MCHVSVREGQAVTVARSGMTMKGYIRCRERQDRNIENIEPKCENGGELRKEWRGNKAARKGSDDERGAMERRRREREEGLEKGGGKIM